MMPLLAVASVVEMQPEADMGAVAVAAVACNFMERERHPKQEGLADIPDNMSEMDFFRNLRLTRTSFDLILDFAHEAYGLNPSGSSLYLGPREALVFRNAEYVEKYQRCLVCHNVQCLCPETD